MPAHSHANFIEQEYSESMSNSLFEALGRSPPQTPLRSQSMPSNSFHPCVSFPLGSKASDPGRGGTVGGKLNHPAFGFGSESQRDTPTAPGRMENLRILIEEAKAATAKGRLSEAIRKYETALVTLPEAYKPRVRNKIARLEGRLNVSKEQKTGVGSPRTLARLSRELHGDLGGSGAVPGPLDLLHIAVKDVTGSERGACASAASAPLSSRSSSPLAWGSCPITDGANSPRRVSCEEGDESERGDEQEQSHGSEDQDKENKVSRVGSDRDVERLGEMISSHLTVAGRSQEGLASCSASSSSAAGGFTVASAQVEATGRPGLGTDGMKWDGKVKLDSDDDEPSRSKDCTKQGRLRLSNKALSDTLEKQIVDQMNQASYEELVSLHEIGFLRAQRILKTRAVTPFEGLSDLSRIGMFPKQIEKMGKHNMLERLDVGPSPADRPRAAGPSDSVDFQEQS